MTFPTEPASDRIARCERTLRRIIAAIDGLRLDDTGRNTGLHPEVQVHLEAAAREMGVHLMPGTPENSAPGGPV
jgi:hypothetical protein